ncbi:TIGR01244 family phosphatase [Roseovarius gahaiensis]|uniref:TIGR01244 family phosphatase n=1 Tax=Roseovarius gahaiensis TaxID=2716691 RepID=A0A967B8I5_9RHOB|nr:TIGR01244 family sulfur transferase [Roseovarius gahaiensis]NHQ73267.1 TIGR01244 family phosphatase [Roseovarius gahaiensis]
MDIRQITPDYAVSPQIKAQDIPDIKAAGFRSIMCNRPDGEEFGQPDFDAIAKAAQDAGLEVRCVPIVSGMVTPQAAQDFATALDQMPKPMLAYCRSGTRCTMLWSIVNHGELSGEDIVAATRNAGYDMAGLVRQLDRG